MVDEAELFAVALEAAQAYRSAGEEVLCTPTRLVAVRSALKI